MRNVVLRPSFPLGREEPRNYRVLRGGYSSGYFLSLLYVKKNYSESFTKQKCEIEAGRQVFTVCRLADEHE